MSDTSVTGDNNLLDAQVDNPERLASEAFSTPQATRADHFALASQPAAIDTREQERQLIGLVLSDPASVDEDVLSLPSECMSSDGHRLLWEVAVQRAYAGHEQADIVGVERAVAEAAGDEFPGAVEQARRYMLRYGFGMVGLVAHTLAEEVMRGHQARMIERRLVQAWSCLSRGRVAEAGEIMTSLDPGAGVQDRWVTLRQAWKSAQEDAQNPAMIIPTPWRGINRYLEGGMRARQVYVLAGLAGTGKTAAAQQVVDRAASEGRTVAVFSLEMGQVDLARRQMSTSGRVPMGEVMRPDLQLTRESTQAVNSVLERIGDRVLIDDSEELTIAQLRARARVVVRRERAELIVVDYAQLVGHDNERLTERETIAEVVKGITQMAKELGIPVLLLAQPNRNAVLQGRRLEMSDLYGSGALEKFAAAVILLNRVMDQDGDGNPIPSELVDFDIRKNRFGPNDVSVRTLADLSRQRFEELD